MGIIRIVFVGLYVARVFMTGSFVVLSRVVLCAFLSAFFSVCFGCGFYMCSMLCKVDSFVVFIGDSSGVISGSYKYFSGGSFWWFQNRIP